MAQGYSCDNEDGLAAVFLITNLTNGDTAAFCAQCFPPVARAMAGAIEDAINPADAMDDTVIDPLVASVDQSEAPPNGDRPKSRARHVAPTEGAEEVTVTSAQTSDDE